MNITSLHFKDLLNWFKSSRYKFLMIFLGSNEECDKEIIQHYLDNRVLIDRQTGDSICFIHFITNVPIMAESKSKEELISHIKTLNFMDKIFHIFSGTARSISSKELSYSGLIAGYDACDDICEFYNIYRYELPAILLIPNGNIEDFSIFPIKSVHDFDSFMAPVKLMDDFLKDISIPTINPSSEELSDTINSIKAQISFLEHYDYENFRRVYLEINQEILSLLKSLDVPVVQKVLTPVDLMRILKQNGIQQTFIRKYNGLYSAMKKNYKRVSKGPISEDDINAKLSELKKKLIRCTEEFESASDKEKQIKSKLFKIPETCERYQKKFEELLLVPDASDIIASLRKDQIVLHEVFVKVINRYVHRSGVVRELIDDIRNKVRDKKFKVFISCKSEDYERGEEVYAFLKSYGMSPFIASKSLREIGGDKYGEVISEVIDSCEHMIVFATDIAYLRTPYVQSEWSLFCNEARSGRKHGKLLSIVSDGMDVTSKDFPIDLRNREVLRISDYQSCICEYLS